MIHVISIRVLAIPLLAPPTKQSDPTQLARTYVDARRREQAQEKAMASEDSPSLLQQADELYRQQKYREALDLLEPEAAESEDTELLWRVMRLYFRLGKEAKDDEAKAGELAKKAYETSERGLKVNENSFGIQKVKS